MTGGNRIIAFEPGAPDSGGPGESASRAEDSTPWPAPAPSTDVTEDLASWGEAEGSRGRTGGVIAPVLAAVAVVGWTVFYLWANRSMLEAPAAPAEWASRVQGWSGPTLLVLVLLLLAMRASRRESARFADAARMLSLESERLESRLATVNTELSLARDFIAAQSRDLEALGRIAVDRLSGSAGRLQELIVGNGAQVDRIAEVSDHALENMEKLRGQLPVIANSAKDVTNTIANAGRTAHIQLEDLVVGFQRLNEFGLASERQVTHVREQVDQAMAHFTAALERVTQHSDERFAALATATGDHREKLDQEEIAALAGIRARSDALAEELARQRTVIAAAEEETMAALAARFFALRAQSDLFARALGESEDAALRQFEQRAGTELAALRQGFEELGRDHDTLLAASRERLAAFEEAARDFAARIEAEGDAIDTQLAARRRALGAEAEAQEADLARRLAALEQTIAERRTAIAAAGSEAADALARKLAALDATVEAQRERQLEDARKLGNHVDAVGSRVATFGETLRASGEQGADAVGVVENAIAALNQRLIDMREALSDSGQQVDELMASAVRLLELVQAGSEHTRAKLPEALRGAESGLGDIEDRVEALRASLREAGDAGRSLSDNITSTRGDLVETMESIARLQDSFARTADAQEAKLAALRETLREAREDSETLSHDIAGRLTEAVRRLSQAAVDAGAGLREGATKDIEDIAEKLGEESTAAIMRVLQGRGAELIARLEDAIDSAAVASRDTAIQMRDQLAKVDELAGNLENRVARARERAEEQVDNDFARRAALITESLNSTSIDIAKALSADVSETAWASYLRGDRGIFTRRAVSLLDSADTRAVQQHYESDRDFREHVNRYIHDFETMLRQLLSTRDGNALGVTLLSSDMGKLYVALAQGIERLRT